MVVHDMLGSQRQVSKSKLLTQDPVTASPAVLVKRYSITQHKELEHQLSLRHGVLQRCVMAHWAVLEYVARWPFRSRPQKSTVFMPALNCPIHCTADWLTKPTAHVKQQNRAHVIDISDGM